MNRPGDASNSEIGCYKPSNVTQADGLLVIRTASDTSCAGYSYTSGMIQTKSFKFTYGTVEFRAKFRGRRRPLARGVDARRELSDVERHVGRQHPRRATGRSPDRTRSTSPRSSPATRAT